MRANGNELDRVVVRFFAVLRERTGVGSDEFELSERCGVNEFEDMVIARYPVLVPYRSSWRVAINQAYTGASAAVEPGDEVAFITPVSGG